MGDHLTPEQRAREIVFGGGWSDNLGAWDHLERLIADAIRSAVSADREAILQALPGGTHCDPQEIADMIRARAASKEGDR